ncbi:geranylgeranylglycerol-phosphate geranylgeranyltransferase [Methanolobus vulcani]|uniref:Digeranylgeranylglyceryl phosphate synthase n=1 Tax=Methanolobus vulcani TaxID=38026 RepID=A0A7Z7AW26_9EURY|nr:geranylgeranylglycerol-phosphate geranylgeranyltransferase [Methanolobus vulcani]MDK2826790.1 geranylgeranylglycerol-phosphate geranylgeranyltransferase [Methanolobus sp.]MDK2947640.1 geranylgeranylglycerol-phosphate geranylgeranyltransferase [Methanolobus sp.]SDF69911.1 geranylgeranylglycerol-phosphate geranylgeranyltransferase [Methanolobus vulcani]
MQTYLKLMRSGNCLMAAIAALVGVFIAYNIVSANISLNPYQVTLSTFPILDSLKVFLVVFLITGAGNAINDYFDIDIDRINKPDRPIPSGKISLRTALYFSLALFAAGSIIAASINMICGAIAVVNSLLLIYYASTLKRTALLGNIAVGYLTGSTFLFGGAVFFEYGGIKDVFVLFVLATMATIAREIVKDIEDIEGDREDGAQTLPIIIGPKKAAYIASLIGLVAVLASPLPYIQSLMTVRYLILVAIADTLFAVAVYEILGKNDPARSSKMFKMAMAFALISFIAGA